MLNIIRSWTMITLTLIFVLLYGVALTGWLNPLSDEKMLTRLEPIIFVIIGYYFGRLPCQQNEKTLQEEMTRLAQRADAAQCSREQAQQAREALEERVKNVRAALTSTVTERGLTKSLEASGGTIKEEALRHSVIAALSILNS